MPRTEPPDELRTNRDRLVRVRCAAEIVHPVHRGHLAVDWWDRPVALPGMAGVCRNLRLGSPVFGWAADHGEPGASLGSRDSAQHLAVQVLACLGNPVRVASGRAAGATGTVIGKHAYVLCDFEPEALEQLVPGDSVVVEAEGQGLRLLDHPDIAVRNCSPGLLAGLSHRSGPGRLEVGVVGVVPPELMGAGLGMSSEWANCDVMLHDPVLRGAHRLAELRIGDLVAMVDQDHRFGRGYARGWASVGVVVHALGPVPGHGVGVVTVLTGPADRLGWWVEAGLSISTACGVRP